MKTFKQYITENINSDIKKLSEYGINVVEMYKLGPYHIFLSKSVDEDDRPKYDIALTSNERDFMKYYNQTKIPLEGDVSLKDIMANSKEMMYILRRWAKKYRPIYVGSYNQKRAETYHKILSKWGLRLSEMKTNDKSTGENEGKTNWYFEILSN